MQWRRTHSWGHRFPKGWSTCKLLRASLRSELMASLRSGATAEAGVGTMHRRQQMMPAVVAGAGQRAAAQLPQHCQPVTATALALQLGPTVLQEAAEAATGEAAAVRRLAGRHQRLQPSAALCAARWLSRGTSSSAVAAAGVCTIAGWSARAGTGRVGTARNAGGCSSRRRETHIIYKACCALTQQCDSPFLKR